MSDQDKAKEIERANSYRQMMTNWAWKDFEKELETIRQDALEMAIVSTNLENVYIQRGIVKCIDSIKSNVGSILDER